MNDKQFELAQQQLAEGERIVKSYKAFEGDIRVITQRKGSDFQTRYTVKWEKDGEYPRLVLMS